MKEKRLFATHNQVVPGSSPGGTTGFTKPSQQCGGFFYVYQANLLDAVIKDQWIDTKG